jgi:hypothetical protein
VLPQSSVPRKVSDERSIATPSRPTANSVDFGRLAGFHSVIMMAMFALVAAPCVRVCRPFRPLLPKESTIRRR